jgi:hypothetical protein
VSTNDDHIRAVVAAAPPLSVAQKTRIAALIRSGNPNRPPKKYHHTTTKEN